MIIETQDDVPAAVLGEMHRTPEARTKEVLSSFVKHLHAFIREVRLTEREFQEKLVFASFRQGAALDDDLAEIG